MMNIDVMRTIIGILTVILTVAVSSCTDYGRHDNQVQYISVSSNNVVDKWSYHMVDDSITHYDVELVNLGNVRVSKVVYDAIDHGRDMHVDVALVFINNHGSRHLLLD